MKNIIRTFLLVFVLLFSYSSLSATGDGVTSSSNGYNPPIFDIVDGQVRFQAYLEDGKVYTSWSKFDVAIGEDAKFRYYKVVRSKTNDNPVYPDDGYIKYISDVNTLSFVDNNPLSGISYYRVCAIISNKDRYCSNVVKIENGSDSEPKECSAEAKLCPDGKTYVGRKGPNCEFAKCPNSDNVKVCPLIYAPVCGKTTMAVGISGEEVSRKTVYKTFSNKCMLDNNENYEYAYSGECKKDKDYYISPVIKKKIDKLLSDFYSKVEAKYSSNEKRISVLENVIVRLNRLANQKPKYKNIIRYMNSKIREKINTYGDVLIDFKKIFSDY